jgi:hypothetical protein
MFYSETLLNSSSRLSTIETEDVPDISILSQEDGAACEVEAIDDNNLVVNEPPDVCSELDVFTGHNDSETALYDYQLCIQHGRSRFDVLPTPLLEFISMTKNRQQEQRIARSPEQHFDYEVLLGSVKLSV